ncbi:MAG: hypothetical protein M3Y80_12030, partial [Verrucomicrobiota bacterium]|nr:hypothetical protein [Verrucomicrobiota bacterium]
LGRDLQVCREPESSLRGAAVHALNHVREEAPRLRSGRVIRHRPALAEKHRNRRQQQAAFEQLMQKR